MISKHWLKRLVCLAAAMAVFSIIRPAAAAITVTDMAGRVVTINEVPQRIALQDGRVGMDLVLLDRSAPFQRVVVWNNLLRRSQPGFWALMSQKWPQAASIPDMGFDDNGAVNLEELIAAKPQILIAELRARPVLEQQGAMRALAALHIPVVFVDDSEHPVPGAVNSVLLLGKILGKQQEAQAYYDFYQSHYEGLQSVIAKQPEPHPTVFVEALAGQNDANNCCFTHGNFGWGLLVQALGAHNLGSSILHTPSGQITPEALLAAQPDAVIMTGRAPSTAMVPMGFNTSPQQAGARLLALESRPGIAQLNAVKNDRVYGIYHPFYSSVLNIIGLEYLAKFIYPTAFPDLDPGKTYSDILAKFTDLPQAPALFAMQVPTHG